jgi:hypothetical protein
VVRNGDRWTATVDGSSPQSRLVPLQGSARAFLATEDARARFSEVRVATIAVRK